MRLDRSLSLALFHPLERMNGNGRLARLPVLMYHSLSTDPEKGVAGYYKTNTDPMVFRRQMEYLASQGYKSIDSKQMMEHIRQQAPIPEKTVLITFDDGFQDFYTHGFPALKEHGLKATMFLPTAFIHDQRRSFKGTPCLTWDEVRELRKSGMEFGSHTVNHPKLVDLPRPEVVRELTESKQEIERQLDEPICSFAYPYAFPQENRSFSATFSDLLIQAGYSCCLTTELGRVGAQDNPYRLKRLPVNSLDDTPLLRAKLDGGYDWLATPQKAFKKLKRRMQSVFGGNSLANSTVAAIS